MAVAQGNSTDPPYNSYKVPGLVDPILETPQISYLEDRYVLGEELGWGQFGVIRACSDMLTGRTLACKSIAKGRLLSSDDLRSVKLEIEVMARLSGHPNVVALKAVYEEEDCVHLVMELCAGGELFDRLKKHGCFSEHEAAILFRHLMEVVMYCHGKGIVHRDLKPENILLATKSSTSPIKLADFGLAAYIKPGQSLYGTVGSPFYIAPEVLAGGYNEAADVWSAGVILYILLSGMPPFWGKTKSRIFESVRSAELWFPSDPWGGVSQSAKDLIAGMLCRDPAQRLTAKQVLDHAWIKDHAQEPNVSCGNCNETNSGQGDMRNCSFCTALVPATRDISFSSPSPIPCRTQADHSSPAFSCRSSFSPFMVDATPCSPPVGWSFRSSFESSSLEFSTPIPSMPSFSFFSPLNEQENLLGFTADRSNVNTIQRDSSFGKFFMSPDPTACFSHDVRESEPKGVRKVITTWSRATGIHHRRNHTIGLGEHEQLDLMVSESIIRWASCTQLSSTPSLRSSLVC
ncbi:calcium-dependent protein kinase 26-like [Phoenix dactylifera]|uniref:Calcium-dependent protein kinase 26-like n=1 Tax=Phoenix dactylifera TaxID=42345 RepID=A0A8B7CZV6_PHODC|nr:calcium-dependent protein kinase 26-like [Phoenix dactylifera]